jgi:hypothetical protein
MNGLIAVMKPIEPVTIKEQAKPVTVRSSGLLVTTNKLNSMPVSRFSVLTTKSHKVAPKLTQDTRHDALPFRTWVRQRVNVDGG